MIEAGTPDDWHDLQEKAAQILRECGFEAYTDQEVRLARGTVSVDILARDRTTTPPSTLIGECKLWQGAVSKNAVHAFRTVIADSGANRGFLISSGGFQSGAIEAAEYTNIDLVTWPQFQEMFFRRWFQVFMAPTLLQEGDALVEYTEPINSRIARRASAFGDEQRERFAELQHAHAQASLELLLLWQLGRSRPSLVPQPPLQDYRGPLGSLNLPAEILNAPALRSLMDAVIQYYRSATAGFDELFGGRA